MLNKMNWK